VNAVDVLKYGNLTVLRTIEGLPEADWRAGGVCGWWSVKDILAHLASFERVLVDVFRSCLNGGPTPMLDQFTGLPGDEFNAVQVDQRKNKSVREILDEYRTVQARTMELARQIPVEGMRQAGILPWYGMEYDLDDFIAYTFYGHKREHCAQINVFRDAIKR
jgi:hypothetical protein